MSKRLCANDRFTDDLLLRRALLIGRYDGQKPSPVPFEHAHSHPQRGPETADLSGSCECLCCPDWIHALRNSFPIGLQASQSNKLQA